jgi:hypothetical protein
VNTETAVTEGHGIEEVIAQVENAPRKPYGGAIIGYGINPADVIKAASNKVAERESKGERKRTILFIAVELGDERESSTGKSNLLAFAQVKKSNLRVGGQAVSISTTISVPNKEHVEANVVELEL